MARSLPVSRTYDQFAADCNATGLTATGRTLINTMMDMGFIIDVDHMSRLMVDDVLAIATTRSYPLVSGHSLLKGGEVGHEFSLTDGQVASIRQLGGMVSAITPKGECSTSSGLRPAASLPAPARLLVAALAPLLLTSSDAWAAWSVGGLECVLSAFLVTAAYLTYLRTLDAPLPPEAAASAALEPTRGGAAAGAEVVDVAMPLLASQARPMVVARLLLAAALLLVLAFLNHPSNLLLAFPIAVHVLWRIPSGELERRALWGPMGLSLVLLGVWEVWRLTYYHDWLPNTYHAKVGFTSFVLWRGLRFLAVALKALPV